MSGSVGAGLVLAVGSAVALNWGFYVQHGEASSSPRLELRRPLHSLAVLFRNRRWLVGFLTGIGGWALYVAALTLAPLSIVQAAAAGGIGVLAVLVGRISRTQRLAVTVTIGGLVMLAVSLLGGAGSSTGGSWTTVVAWLVVSAVVAALACGAGSARLARGAGFGIAAGVLYAAGDVATKAAAAGGSHLAFVPAVFALHGLAFVALQLGFQRGGALATAGMATLWTNALPIAAGMLVFEEPLPSGPLGALRVAAFVAVVVGAVLLARPSAETRDESPADTPRPTGRRRRRAVLVVSALTLVLVGVAAGRRTHDAPPVAGFTELDHGPAGGTVWTGRIVNPYVRADTRLSDIYLPPGYSTTQQYPVVYFLHGFWGSPSSFVDSFRLADMADALIKGGSTRPFIVVMPPGGPLVRHKQGEWAGAWESYVIHTVIPWTDSHLPTETSPQDRAIAGLSAGGYGAVDMALRHLGMFGAAESWEGYFTPFRDGPFVHASAADLAAHDPVLLVRKHAAAVRRDHLRFFLSTGPSHGVVKRVWTLQFAQELASLHIARRLWLLLPGEKRFGRLQLPDALRYAEPAG